MDSNDNLNTKANNIQTPETPRVSIIVITYNQQKYIAQCINSILAQETQYPFEIVISDDKSSDETPQIVNNFAKAYPDKVFVNHNDINVGIVKNYLNALGRCRGKYLCLLGGDDFWIDNLKIQKQVDFLETNPSCGLVYTDYSVLNEITGKSIVWVLNSFKREIIEGRATQIMCLGNSTIMPQTVCIRRKLLNEDYRKIMDDKAFLAEDFPTWFWISYFANIHFMPLNTATYRVHNKSYSNSHTKLKLWTFTRSSIYMRKKLMKFLNYQPDNWNQMNNWISRGVMYRSLKTNKGRKYGLYSYKMMYGKNFEDYFTYVGILIPLLSYPVRASLFLLRKIKIIIPNRYI